MTIKYSTKLKTNRNRRRIWQEGKRLIDAGFLRGMKYSIAWHQKSIVLTLDPDGAMTVSGRSRTKKNGDIKSEPIIDLMNDKIAVMGETGDYVDVYYSDGVIRILRSNSK